MKKITGALRAMRVGDPARSLWPVSGKGGGKAAEHVDHWNLKNLILGAAALQPVDAAEAWASLDGLVCGDITLGEAIEALIDVLSNEKTSNNMMKERGETWQLRLCLDPCVAGISWMVGNKPHVQIFRSTTSGSPPNLNYLRRETIIPLAPFIVAGQLWCDTKRLRHDLMSESESGAKLKEADQIGASNTDRPTPGRKSAHPMKGKLSTSHAQNASSGRPVQARDRAGHSSTSTGSYDDAGIQPELRL